MLVSQCRRVIVVCDRSDGSRLSGFCWQRWAVMCERTLHMARGYNRLLSGELYGIKVLVNIFKLLEERITHFH